ncbi:TetR/AcrR family transcriptional regulator [Mesorhizobium australafricanum]|uniref:Helix-turn-helix domain-containing protein n=1 Tax=Mesorhizobium australafricanum TaxID=3072311 RepID=A0ABU4WTF3_9HYPH|nr:helix-turn-helix domain-containing protein [Mesorhizobium sp. VK3E]MDX8438786.1 helix-turn-helix domain-containing protein [Mesorhizobium sp. VK3E]
MTTRKYQQKKRAERAAETRQSILDATIELHRTVGPAATQISEIASRAGVQRVTVYDHFPDEQSLLAACSSHWRELHPAPDPAAWLTIEIPSRRISRILWDLYAWYRETEPMTANVMRDAELRPVLKQIIEQGLGQYLDAVRRILAEAAGADSERRMRVDAAINAAINFHTWRSLASLGDKDAAELAAGLIELAVAR